MGKTWVFCSYLKLGVSRVVSLHCCSNMPQSVTSDVALLPAVPYSVSLSLLDTTDKLELEKCAASAFQSSRRKPFLGRCGQQP